ncbi:lysophosphatidic acid receptor 6-like [Stegostoma tigrinum]|uniref:lysophosphatidic acid receptor 6-like n=1 Tax=Stegostoma tigrinum TaxID=3053191 RepID=UPI002870995D|nr:lysophosphatidic acid receptor 6-like [Stegostoma tigrinum]
MGKEHGGEQEVQEGKRSVSRQKSEYVEELSSVNRTRVTSEPHATNMNQTVKSLATCTGNRTLTDSVKSVQVVVNAPTFVFGLFLNVGALCLLCVQVRKWTVSTIYMTNLIVSDILLLFSLPFKIYAYQSETWSLGAGFCKFLESLYYVNTYASILIITLISLDRYITIKHPFLARTFRSTKKTVLACSLVWIVVWSCCLGMFFKRGMNSTTNCFFNYSDSVWSRTVVSFLQCIFLVSAFIMVFCSIQIIRTLQKSGNQKPEDKSNSKSVKIVLSNLLTFLVCFTPYHVGMLVYFLARNCWIADSYLLPVRNFLQICLCLANINCVLDAIYYYFVVKEFWKRNRKSLKSINLAEV